MSPRIEVLPGDCLDVIRTLADCSIDAVCTDPPYALTSIVKRFGNSVPEKETYINSSPKTGYMAGYMPRAGFMGKKWDTGDVAHSVEFWAEVLRVLKPGGHLVALGGTRTYHRLACAIEDAGFEIRDQLQWITGQGFPKAHNLKSYPICSCDSGNAAPYNHNAEQKTERDMRPMRLSDVPEAVNSGDERGQVLQSRVSQLDAQEFWAARSEPETGDGEQPRLEGRELHRAGEGLPHGHQSEASESACERLRAGAHLSCREDAWPSVEGRRGGSPQGPGPSEQRPVEFADIREPQRPLVDGTLPDRGRCPRCGKLRQEFEGFSSALKPANEPICLARKPLSEPGIHANVLRWGTGALNIDATRIGTTVETWPSSRAKPADGEPNAFYTHKLGGNDKTKTVSTGAAPPGRWPANIILDGSPEVLAGFPESKGAVSNGKSGVKGIAHEGYGGMEQAPSFGDSGSAARFFYHAKADANDRIGSRHPTIKPVALMRWLVKLICPPGGTVLDCFAGSGTTGEAAWREGFNAILIEREAEYLADIARRMEHVQKSRRERRQTIAVARVETAGPLFEAAE